MVAWLKKLFCKMPKPPEPTFDERLRAEVATAGGRWRMSALGDGLRRRFYVWREGSDGNVYLHDSYVSLHFAADQMAGLVLADRGMVKPAGTADDGGASRP